ncbi:hypothetical protein ACU61A_15875 [Pseudonocardia sichuanensis]
MTLRRLIELSAFSWTLGAIGVIVMLCAWVVRLESRLREKDQVVDGLKARLRDDDGLLDDLGASDEEIARMLAAWRNEAQR